MSTTRKTISISDKQDAWVKSRTSSGDFSNDSEYFRHLIRKDQTEKSKISYMQLLVNEALEGGQSDMSVSDIWAASRQKFESSKS